MLKVLTVVGLFAARVPAEVPKLNPQFHVDFNANRAEKTMHTFYQPFPNRSTSLFRIPHFNFLSSHDEMLQKATQHCPLVAAACVCT